MQLPATSAIMGLPLHSVTARGLVNDWYMLRYPFASEWVEVFSACRTDLLALITLLENSIGVSCELYALSADGSTFNQEVW